MSDLPERASLEYLRKLAKERLRKLRLTDPRARLSDAHLALAREYGFSSWRSLKAEVERRASPMLDALYSACVAGDLQALRAVLDRDPSLSRERFRGTTALHMAVRHPEAVRLLLDHGADPNARDDGDNALALHFAAGRGHIDSVRALLDAGSDVHGSGDAHRLDVMGWATCFEDGRRDVVDLLVARGARHHVFSAIALGDDELLRRLVQADPRALERRLSPFEQEPTALHYVIAPPDGLVGGLFRTGEHYRTLETLIELGADLEARDAKGRTPLAIALLRGDLEAARRLQAAGAREPDASERPPAAAVPDLGASIAGLTPMLGVPDVEATVSWYQLIGFELVGSHAEDGPMNWARVRLGKAEIMFTSSTDPWHQATRGLSLWVGTSRLDDLYSSLKHRQLGYACAALAEETSQTPQVHFTVDLYTAFYGQREFGIRDPNGVELMFAQPVECRVEGRRSRG